VFTGAMDWFPNEDGILDFLDTTLPLIQREVPDVSLTIVGRNPSERLRTGCNRPGVYVTGTVDDVRPYVDEAAVYVVPLRIGGGTRLKIFEALAMGKPVVSTTIGAEGLPMVDGEHFISADSPAEMARAVVSLLRDPARRRALGSAGRELVEQRHSWQRVALDFEQLCKEATSHAH
jgi:polysaccharide biosynthesis protein PslH